MERPATPVAGADARTGPVSVFLRGADDEREPKERVSDVAFRVSGASWELTVLAGKLVEPTPGSARGVAQARLLFTDGRGLCNTKTKGSVRDGAGSAVADLSPAA